MPRSEIQLPQAGQNRRHVPSPGRFGGLGAGRKRFSPKGSTRMPMGRGPSNGPLFRKGLESRVGARMPSFQRHAGFSFSPPGWVGVFGRRPAEDPRETAAQQWGAQGNTGLKSEYCGRRACRKFGWRGRETWEKKRCPKRKSFTPCLSRAFLRHRRRLSRRTARNRNLLSLRTVRRSLRLLIIRKDRREPAPKAAHARQGKNRR